MDTPFCCGMPSYLNRISPTLEFYVCKECKQEVKEYKEIFVDINYTPTMDRTEWVDSEGQTTVWGF